MKARSIQRKPVSEKRRSGGTARGTPRRSPEPLGGISLGQVLKREGESFWIRVGKDELRASVDPSVDPRLLDEAVTSGARVVLTFAPEPSIVGALATSPTLQLNREGNLEATMNRFTVTAGEVLLRTGGSFLQLKSAELELYSTRILCRARELTRLLGRMIKLN